MKSAKKWLFLLTGALVITINTKIADAVPANITYVDFSDLSDFTLNGSAAAINASPVFFNGQNVLRLTDDFNQAGSAFLTKPVYFQTFSFSAYFQFQITDSQNSGADGWAFVMQPWGQDRLGGGGGGIGYSGIPRSFELEVDTYQNGWDSSSNQFGINFNGNMTSVHKVKIVDTDLDNGDIFHTWLDYNDDKKEIELRLARGEITGKPGPQNLIFSGVDIPAALQTNRVYLGFTSGTGYASSDHDIRSWTFDYVASNTIPVPEPASILLLATGLIGVLGIKRKE